MNVGSYSYKASSKQYKNNENLVSLAKWALSQSL